MARVGGVAERTRQRILRAGLRCFAERGYAATAMQDIARAARVSKPALYYHFRDKADLFRALVTEAHEARHRRLAAALQSGHDIRSRLVAVMQTMFESFCEDRELYQLAVATMFAPAGDAPRGFDCRPLCQRNFELVRNAMQAAREAGELSRHYTSEELAQAFYGLAHHCLAASLIFPGCRPDRRMAERLVQLFLQGAAAVPGPPGQQAASNGRGGGVRPAGSDRRAKRSRPEVGRA
ncbi:TetR/AcrR family transcriptional regulator [Limisphaera sp. VF-2]|jgi:AcrR family transcriptional regulator|uniref:TetR/AcrR family transcriptional regulator n=1 Tax=Limisphaera sp. VF-2 TaxID=3400418 RepID=UPI001772D6F1|nr:TetR/AcrR family transcriptional regulator [Limisphaera sp.]